MRPRKEPTATVSSRLKQSTIAEIHTHLENSDMTINDFLTEAAEEKLANESPKIAQNRANFYKNLAKYYQNLAKTSEDKSKDLKSIPEQEAQFLAESYDLIKQNPGFLKGRINLYQNKFGKGYRLKENEFMELLERAKKQVSTRNQGA